MTMKPTIKNIFLGTLASAVLLLGCNQDASETPPSAKKVVNVTPKPSPAAIPVDGYVVKPASLQQTINATGSLIAYEDVDIRSERPGKLVELDFKESSFVSKGTKLAKIDDDQLQAERKRLEISLDLAEKEVARGRELLKIQGISAEEMDRLLNRVDAIKAEQEVIDIQIEKSSVKAPFSGVIGLRQKSIGAYVTPNDIIVDLKQINPIKLEFDVPEKFMSTVREGQKLTFSVVGLDKDYSANVYALDSEISATTRTFKVRASSKNPGNRLKPGQFAKITLITGKNDKAIMIPTDAVIPVLEGKQVYLLKNGKAQATPVVVNDRRAGNVEITDGIVLGDTVVVSGLMALTNGTPITIRSLLNVENTSE